ncbi:adenosine receptor A1-like [Orbicella faveolata]|uniref:adenosine receptor A1-like n=1 Tax=Orbicella faveolata TaxID=48498 RepID=UPI0009E1E647|nr:adenosine receptor A1-like [Orbicella faveolata]
MPSATAIVFTAVFTVETLVIIIGNTLTIFVFWTHRFHLKGTYFLLINLAVADLLVGVTESKVLGSEKIPNLITEAERKRSRDVNPTRAFQVLGFTSSVFFLALISLERVFAVLWPLRHRVTSTRAYVCSIFMAWAAGFSMAAISTLLPTYHPEVSKVSAVTVHSCLSISLLVICASYFTICNHLRTKTQGIQVHFQNAREQTLRLSRTLFIVVAVSLVVWLPAFVIFSITAFCRRCFPPHLVLYANVLHLANSMVNPFVYSFRMPTFKVALKKLWRKRQKTVKLRTVPENQERNFDGITKATIANYNV